MRDGCVHFLYNSSWTFHQLAASGMTTSTVRKRLTVSPSITYKSTPAGSLSSSQPGGPPCWASPLAFGLQCWLRSWNMCNACFYSFQRTLSTNAHRYVYRKIRYKCTIAQYRNKTAKFVFIKYDVDVELGFLWQKFRRFIIIGTYTSGRATASTWHSTPLGWRPCRQALFHKRPRLESVLYRS